MRQLREGGASVNPMLDDPPKCDDCDERAVWTCPHRNHCQEHRKGCTCWEYDRHLDSNKKLKRRDERITALEEKLKTIATILREVDYFPPGNFPQGFRERLGNALDKHEPGGDPYNPFIPPGGMSSRAK